MRVYISSTAKDLCAYRDAAIKAVMRLGHDVMAMEYYVAEDIRPVERCLSDVASCDVYIGILAWRYGYIPQAFDKSITELEYRQAERKKKPQLMFLLAEDAEWPAEFIDPPEAGGDAIRALRAECMTERMTAFFHNPDELAAELTAALARFEPPRRNIGNIFEDPQDFFDRTTSLNQLHDMLTNPVYRLIIIVGHGGIGKTFLLSKLGSEIERGELRLTEAATQLGADGLVSIRCSKDYPLTLERLYSDIGRMLGPRHYEELQNYWRDQSRSLEDKATFLLSTLQDGCYVLFLDNFEDVMAEDSTITEPGLRAFIEGCLRAREHAIRLIITSRRHPVLRPELEGAFGKRRGVVPLSEGLPDADAIALLKVKDRDNELGIHDASDATLLEVVHRLNGVPRSLVTLIGTLRNRGNQSLAHFIEDQAAFTRLEENPARELFDSLTPNERIVVQTLAVFDLPADATALRAVLPEMAERVDELLVRLHANHVVDEQQDGCTLHSLDKQYAYQQLPETGSAFTRRELHLRVARYLVDHDPEAGQWSSRDALSQPLRAFDHFVRAGDFDIAYRYAETFLFKYLWLWGYFDRMIEVLSEVYGRVGDRDLQQCVAGNLGLTYWSVGRPEEAVPLLEQALQLAHPRRHMGAVAAWVGNLGLCHFELGDLSRAIRCLKHALALDRRTRDRQSAGIHYCDLGVLYRNFGDYGRALRSAEKGLINAREAGDIRVTANLLANIGRCHYLRGNLEEAERYYNEGLARALECQSGAGKYYHYLGLADCALCRGDWNAAYLQGQNAYACEFPAGRHFAALIIGIALLSSDAEKSEKYFTEAIGRSDAFIVRSSRDHYARYCRALALTAIGRLKEARVEFERAITICPADGLVTDMRRYLILLTSFLPENQELNDLKVLLANARGIKRIGFHL